MSDNSIFIIQPEKGAVGIPALKKFYHIIFVEVDITFIAFPFFIINVVNTLVA